MAVTPTQAREFTKEESLFLHSFEIQVDIFIRATGLGFGDTTITYPVAGQDKLNLSNKVRTEAIEVPLPQGRGFLIHRGG